nr:MAG TPA: hypothetical protein [Caudoviricetes sp.]
MKKSKVSNSKLINYEYWICPFLLLLLFCQILKLRYSEKFNFD